MSTVIFKRALQTLSQYASSPSHGTVATTQLRRFSPRVVHSKPHNKKMAQRFAPLIPDRDPCEKVSLDTLAVAKKLLDGGVPANEAAEISKGLNQILKKFANNFIAKDEFKEIRTRLDAELPILKSELEKFEEISLLKIEEEVRTTQVEVFTELDLVLTRECRAFPGEVEAERNALIEKLKLHFVLLIGCSFASTSCATGIWYYCCFKQ